LVDREQWTDQLVRAIVDVLPEGTTFGFSYEGDQVFFTVSRGADTNEVYANALRLLDERGETP
jgi:hypothetical protein